VLGAAEWIWIIIVAIFWIIQAFTRKREEEPQQPLPTPRKPQNRPRPQQQPYGSPPASPAPRHEETAPTPEQQIRNFLQELQRRMAEQQQRPRAAPPPPPPSPRQPAGVPQPQPELEPVAEVLIEQPTQAVEAEMTEAELASQAAAQAYTLPVEGPTPARRRLAFDRNSIRTAFIMREVLGPPRAEQPF
jgi:hypothetical protein